MLPRWERGTPGVLCASGPHPIPISTAVRTGDDRLLLALGGRRETLDRLREDPRAAFCLLGAGVAFTAYGMASVVSEPLIDSVGVVAVEVRVERVQDHLADGRTAMLDGARWRWIDDRAAEIDADILEALDRLAAAS